MNAVHTWIEAAAPPGHLVTLQVPTVAMQQGPEPGLICLGKMLCDPPGTRGDGRLGRSCPQARSHSPPASAGRLLGDHFSPPPEF